MQGYVRWRELEPEISRFFPLTVQDILLNGGTATVRHLGSRFILRRILDPFNASPSLQVWGPAAISSPVT